MDTTHALPTLPTADEIEALAKSAGLSIPQLCIRANVQPSTFYRWREGTFGLNTALVQRLIDAIHTAQQEAAQEPPARVARIPRHRA